MSDQQRFGASGREINPKKQFHFPLLSHNAALNAQKNFLFFVLLCGYPCP